MGGVFCKLADGGPRSTDRIHGHLDRNFCGGSLSASGGERSQFTGLSRVRDFSTRQKSLGRKDGVWGAVTWTGTSTCVTSTGTFVEWRGLGYGLVRDTSIKSPPLGGGG